MSDWLIFSLLVVWMLLDRCNIYFRQPTKEKHHEPLLEVRGKPITGLMRCRHCGLSETYWDKWPSCEHREF